jgi:hypothetical protein
MIRWDWDGERCECLPHQPLNAMKAARADEAIPMDIFGEIMCGFGFGEISSATIRH